MDETNPYLKAAFMEVVDNQIANNDPPETRETLNRLTSQGISEEDARLYIGQAVCIEVWDIMKNKRVFNLERFVRNLENLPEEPKE
ncbi:MAG: hypothetical protein ABIJ00_04250 [Candidatus Eisenbacteria bacterium]